MTVLPHVPPSEVALLRVVAQRLAGAPWSTAGEAVGHLTCVQAQDYRGALTSVALRTQGRDTREAVAALDGGEVVLTWPMRGTLHLLRAEDVGWVVPLCAPRAEAAAAGRQHQLGLTDAHVERAAALTQEALGGGRLLDRAALLAAWEAGGLDVAEQRGPHLLRRLAQAGLVCLGPVEGSRPAYVLVEEWVPAPRRLEREEALGELARRYFRGHGPATVADLARWAGIGVRDTRAGLALAREDLAAVDVDGTEHWLDPATPDLLATARRAARALMLLPGFDELVLGYADRSATLAPEHAARVVPGGNGMFRATVVHEGRVVGTWRHAGTGSRRRVEAEPFSELPAAVEDALADVYASLPR